MGVHAHNVANIETENFKKSRTIFRENTLVMTAMSVRCAATQDVTRVNSKNPLYLLPIQQKEKIFKLKKTPVI